jgi:hypothetical protein
MTGLRTGTVPLPTAAVVLGDRAAAEVTGRGELLLITAGPAAFRCRTATAQSSGAPVWLFINGQTISRPSSISKTYICAAYPGQCPWS